MKKKSGSLRNCRIILLREEPGSEFGLLRRLGADVVNESILSKKPTNSNLSDLTGRLKNFQWIVLTSESTVREAAKRWKNLPRSTKIAAIGPRTDMVIKKIWRRSSDFVPSVFTSEALGHELPIRKSDKVLLVRSANAGRRMDQVLSRRGARVTRRSPYRLHFKGLSHGLLNEIVQGKFDFIFFGAASQVKAFARSAFENKVIRDAKKIFSRGDCRALAIGPEADKALKKLGLKSLMAPVHTFEGMINLAVNLWKQ